MPAALEAESAGAAEFAGAGFADGEAGGSLELASDAPSAEGFAVAFTAGALAGVSGVAPAGVLATSGCPAQPSATSKLGPSAQTSA